MGCYYKVGREKQALLLTTFVGHNNFKFQFYTTHTFMDTLFSVPQKLWARETGVIHHLFLTSTAIDDQAPAILPPD